MIDLSNRKTMQLAVASLQAAVDAELERKAKLGFTAVVCDKNGKPKVVSARYLVRQARLRAKNATR